MKVHLCLERKRNSAEFAGGGSHNDVMRSEGFENLTRKGHI